MASSVYHSFFHELMLAAHDLTTTTGTQLTVQLHTNAYVPDVDHAVRVDLTNEHGATGNYVTGGENVTKSAMAPADVDASDYAHFDITEDIVWTAATITAAFAVLVDETHASNALICWFDFGGDKTSTADDFTLAFHANGLFSVA